MSTFTVSILVHVLYMCMYTRTLYFQMFYVLVHVHVHVLAMIVHQTQVKAILYYGTAYIVRVSR